MSDVICPTLMTIGEITKTYGVGQTTVYKHLKIGSLKAIKLGRSTRIWRADLEDWLKSQPSYFVQK